MGSYCRQREAERSHKSFSAMLEEGIDGGNTKIVDLDFGLSSRTAAPVTNTCASSHVVATTVGQTSVHGVGGAGRGGRSCPVGGSADECRSAPSFSRGEGTSGDKAPTVLPPHSTTPSPPPRRRVAAPAANTSTTPAEEIGRYVWDSCRQQMRGTTAENITNEVSRMRVGSDADADDTQRATGDDSLNFHCEDEADDAKELEIRPLCVRGRGRGGCGCQQNRGSRGGRVSKARACKKGGKHPTWSVEEMVKLARELQKRLVEVGVKRTTDDIGKKWNNLFRQYKKVKRYQNASEGNNFFKLTPALRTEEGSSFQMDERLYLEIDNMSRGNKTIYPDNLADTSTRGEVRMPGDTQRPPSVAGESIARGDASDGNNEDGGSARESRFTAGSTGGAGKRKNMRQQTFDAIAEVMEKHGALMADTLEGGNKQQCSIVERQCVILEPEVDAQKRHYEASDEANRMMCTALMEITKAIRDRS
ncbi:hypothetical protein CBR_g23617 [Chara braunii]|uniref:Myb-like domain-containing protein n=1 Tax=Chara braunii TaxID=69332 RepID=A0A388L4W5_CHABU|nr:hypothetical protein CBR_g23617 [Chara braunii]|eukprot:GBG77288.1 hypothetical protein CBR_g23617 [Chara braunii]